MNSRFILLCLIFAYTANAQSNVELQRLNEERSLELATQQSEQLNFLHEKKQTPKVKSQFDNDDDGMDDTWEMENGLDPNDAHDAWQDADNDKVLNLFEFQLITDPNNSNDPVSLDLAPSNVDDIKNALDQAEGQTVFIRLSEGEYFIRYDKFYYADVQIMIQGGWNEDFTEHNPNTYRTILNGEGSEAMIIGTSPSNNSPVEYSALIFDGIEVTNSGDFSLGGGIQMWRFSVVNKTSIYNCRFYENTYYGFDITNRNGAVDSEFFLVNTVIANNPEGGIYTQVSDLSQTRWRVINTTIHNPNSGDGGVDGLTSGTGALDIELDNSINWGNDDYAFNFYSFNDVSVSVENSTVEPLNPDVSDYTEINNLMADPLFVDVPNNDLSLMENSPCIDAGEDLGLAYVGEAPDIGAEEFGLIINTTNVHEQPTFSLIPNILQEGNRSIIFNGLPDTAECIVYIFDEKGRIITQDNATTNGGQIYYSIAKHLSPSTYFVTVDCNGYRFPAQRLVIAE